METKFQKGDIAICMFDGILPEQKNISGKIPPLFKNAEYIVRGVHICPCGNVSLDVGISSNPEIPYNCLCRRKVLGETIWWCNAKRFVKKDTRSMEEKIADAIKHENYELADELTKMAKINGQKEAQKI